MYIGILAHAVASGISEARMYNIRHNRGFSLTEVLLAVATLAVGMVFVGGTYAVGVYYTTVSAERTIAAVVADEAFAKTRLFGLNPNDSDLLTVRMARYEDVCVGTIDPNEFAYPSTGSATDKQYWWSALCRDRQPGGRQGSRLVQVTVFVSRKVGAGSRFPAAAGIRAWPAPMDVQVDGATGNNILTVRGTSGEEQWISPGATMVDDASGRMYRVMERDGTDVELDRPWQGAAPRRVWVVPPPVDGGRDPCIAVYQKVIRF